MHHWRWYSTAETRADITRLHKPVSPQHAYAGTKGIWRFSSNSFATRHWKEVGSKHHAPAALSLGKPQYSLSRAEIRDMFLRQWMWKSCSARPCNLVKCTNDSKKHFASIFRSCRQTTPLLVRTFLSDGCHAQNKVCRLRDIYVYLYSNTHSSDGKMFHMR
jgi:hypothetical protein